MKLYIDGFSVLLKCINILTPFTYPSETILK